jgi:hypothetical protein
MSLREEGSRNAMLVLILSVEYRALNRGYFLFALI